MFIWGWVYRGKVATKPATGNRPSVTLLIIKDLSGNIRFFAVFGEIDNQHRGLIQCPPSLSLPLPGFATTGHGLMGKPPRGFKSGRGLPHSTTQARHK